MRRDLLLLILLCVASAIAGCRFAGDSGKIIDAMEERFDREMEGVRSFSIFADGMAIEHVLTPADSLNTFVLEVSSDSAGHLPESARLISFLYPDIPKLVRGLRTGARLLGTEDRSGRRVYVLEADRPTALIAGSEAPSTDLRSAQVFVDVETYALRGVRMTLSAPDSTAEEEITQTVSYERFREVEGVSIPFKVSSVTTGLTSLIPAELRVVERGALALERRRAEQLPVGPREVELARIAARSRFLNEGIQEDELLVDSVRVFRPAQ